MNSSFQRTPFITQDGSSSLRHLHWKEPYHSIYGAYQESMHVFIHNGLFYFPEVKELKVLEVGFGTGLNAILTLTQAHQRTIDYWTIEAYPLALEEVHGLNYANYLSTKEYELFLQMHQATSGERMSLTPTFHFTKYIANIEEISFSETGFDLIYFDAFAPESQPELWTTDIFQKMYDAMSVEAILVTYCAKGVVKRSMKAVGFEVETLVGPPGKREMIRCIKK